MANSPVNSQGGEIEGFPRKPYSYPSPQAAAEIWNRQRLRRRRKIVSLAVVLAVALPAILLSQWSLAYAASLPDVSQLSNDVPGDSFVYASDNKTVLADLHPSGYQHYYEPLSDMGKALPTAIIAIEDRNFYNEPGVDPAGIARAAIEDIKAGDTQ